MRLRIAMALSAVALVAACGTATQEDPGPGGTSPGPAGGSTAASAAFPLTVTRTGGVAGFNDTIVVQSDGSAEVTSKMRSAPVRCTVAAADLAALSSQVLEVVNAPTPSGTATPDHVVADAIIITMTAASSPPVRMTEPGGAVVPKAVSALVGDVTGNPPANKICTLA